MAKARTANVDPQAEPHMPSPSLRERAAGIDPLIFAAGAAVAGAAIGAFVPRSDAETRLLAPVGRQVNAAAATLGSAARQVVSNEVAKVPVVGQAVADQFEQLVDEVVQPA